MREDWALWSRKARGIDGIDKDFGGESAGTLEELGAALLLARLFWLGVLNGYFSIPIDSQFAIPSPSLSLPLSLPPPKSQSQSQSQSLT